MRFQHDVWIGVVLVGGMFNNKLPPNAIGFQSQMLEHAAYVFFYFCFIFHSAKVVDTQSHATRIHVYLLCSTRSMLQQKDSVRETVAMKRSMAHQLESVLFVSQNLIDYSFRGLFN